MENWYGWQAAAADGYDWQTDLAPPVTRLTALLGQEARGALQKGLFPA